MSPQKRDDDLLLHFRRLCVQRQRFRTGLLNEQTMDSLRLRFGRFLMETGRVTDWPDREGEETEHVSPDASQPGHRDGLVVGAGPDLL